MPALTAAHAQREGPWPSRAPRKAAGEHARCERALSSCPTAVDPMYATPAAAGGGEIGPRAARDRRGWSIRASKLSAEAAACENRRSRAKPAARRAVAVAAARDAAQQVRRFAARAARSPPSRRQLRRSAQTRPRDLRPEPAGGPRRKARVMESAVGGVSARGSECWQWSAAGENCQQILRRWSREENGGFLGCQLQLRRRVLPNSIAQQASERASGSRRARPKLAVARHGQIGGRGWASARADRRAKSIRGNIVSCPTRRSRDMTRGRREHHDLLVTTENICERAPAARDDER